MSRTHTADRRRARALRFLQALVRRPAVVIALALLVRAAVLFVLVVDFAGVHSLVAPFRHLHWSWVLLTSVAELMTYPAYVVAYRSITHLGQHGRLQISTVIQVVIAGFGPLAISGGFGTDRSVLTAIATPGPKADPDRAAARAEAHVGALSMLEWAVLAPVSAGVSLVLLISGAPVSGSLLWPWVIGVPLVAGAAAWATATPARVRRLSQPHHHRLARVERALDGIAALKQLGRRPRRYLGAWMGMTAYWACEIAALDAALHAAGLDLSVGMATMAYATGCLGSRRSLPLGGAGVTEALFVLSLYQLHQPLGPAIVAVLVYRLFNFLAGIVPAFLAHRQLAVRSTGGAVEPT